MSGYWSALARAADAPRQGDEPARATPRDAQPFEDLRGSDADGFVEIDAESSGFPAPAPTEMPADHARAIMPPTPATADQRPASITLDPVTVAPIEPPEAIPATDRASDTWAITAPAAPAFPAPSTPTPTAPDATPEQPAAITAGWPPPSPDSPAPAVAADRAPPPIAPDAQTVHAAPPPDAVARQPIALLPDAASDADTVRALPAIMVSALTEEIGRSVAAAAPTAPPPILITIDRLDIRLGDPIPAAREPRRDRPAPVVSLDGFLRRTGDAS